MYWRFVYRRICVKVSELLELELQTVVSLHVDAGNRTTLKFLFFHHVGPRDQTQVVTLATSTFTCSAISPALSVHVPILIMVLEIVLLCKHKAFIVTAALFMLHSNIESTIHILTFQKQMKSRTLKSLQKKIQEISYSAFIFDGFQSKNRQGRNSCVKLYKYSQFKELGKYGLEIFQMAV